MPLLELPQPGPNIIHAQTDNVTDAHALEPGPPATDECTQDWALLSSEVDADSLVFEAERALNTGDTQDHLFVDDSTEGRVVFLRKMEAPMVSAPRGTAPPPCI